MVVWIPLPADLSQCFDHSAADLWNSIYCAYESKYRPDAPICERVPDGAGGHAGGLFGDTLQIGVDVGQYVPVPPAGTGNRKNQHSFLAPDSIILCLILLTIYFLQKDDLRFGRYFYLAALTCGLGPP